MHRNHADSGCLGGTSSLNSHWQSTQTTAPRDKTLHTTFADGCATSSSSGVPSASQRPVDRRRPSSQSAGRWTLTNRQKYAGGGPCLFGSGEGCSTERTWRTLKARDGCTLKFLLKHCVMCMGADCSVAGDRILQTCFLVGSAGNARFQLSEGRLGQKFPQIFLPNPLEVDNLHRFVQKLRISKWVQRQNKKMNAGQAFPVVVHRRPFHFCAFLQC